MTLKEKIKSFFSRFSKKEMLPEPTMQEILNHYEVGNISDKIEETREDTNGEVNNGWDIVDLKLGIDYKSFFYETIPDKHNIISAQRVSELYSNNLSQNVEEKITKIFDLIVTHKNKIIGYIETIILDDNTAMMSMQHQLAKIKFPNGIEDTDYLTDRNNVAIFVDDNYRNKKVGEQMFNASLRYLNHNGIQRLKIEDIREMAKGFYKKMGVNFEDEKTAVIDVSNAVDKMNDKNVNINAKKENRDMEI